MTDDVGALNGRGNHLFGAGHFAEAISLYRQAVAMAPDLPDLRFNLANALVEAGDTPAALAECRELVALAPDYAPGRTSLGNLLRRMGRLTDALAEYQRAARLDPDNAVARYHVGIVLLDLHRPGEALPWLTQAIAQRSEPTAQTLSPAAYERGVATAMLRMARPAEALAWAQAARRSDIHDAQAKFCEGLIHLTLGNLQAGWPLFESRPSVTRNLPPRWLGKADLRGRTLLVTAEQGMGDAIHFSRYLPLLRERGIRIVLEAPTPLIELLRPLADAIVPVGAELPAFDAHVPIMSLPLVFGTDLQAIPASIPYLSAKPAAVNHWTERLRERGRRRVGLVWSGNPGHPWDALRSIPLAGFASILAMDGVEFHALQPTGQCDVAEFPQIRRHDLTDFSDTAALMSLMDHIVTVDTSAAHLAGALGVPGDLLLQHAPDWRWMLDRSDSPWYPSLRLVRQTRPGDWSAAIGAVAARLALSAA